MDALSTKKSFYEIKWSSVVNAEKDDGEFERKVQSGDGAFGRVMKIRLDEIVLDCSEKQVLLGPRLKQESAKQKFLEADKNKSKLKLTLNKSEDCDDFIKILNGFKQQNIEILNEYLRWIKMIYLIKVKIPYAHWNYLKTICSALTNCINENQDVLSNLKILWMSDEELIGKPVIIRTSNCKRDCNNELKRPDEDAFQMTGNEDPARITELWNAILCPEITSILLAIGGGVQLCFRSICKQSNEIVLKHWTMDSSSILIKDSINGLILHSSKKMEYLPPPLFERRTSMLQEIVQENEEKIKFASEYKFKFYLVLNDRIECNMFKETSMFLWITRKVNRNQYSNFIKYSRDIHTIQCLISEDSNDQDFTFFKNLENTIIEQAHKLYMGVKVILLDEI